MGSPRLGVQNFVELLPLTASRGFLIAATSRAYMQNVGKRQFRIQRVTKGESGEEAARGAKLMKAVQAGAGAAQIETKFSNVMPARSNGAGREQPCIEKEKLR